MAYTYDLLTSESMHAEQLPCTVLQSLVLIAQVVFLLACGHTVTDATDHQPHFIYHQCG